VWKFRTVIHHKVARSRIKEVMLLVGSLVIDALIVLVFIPMNYSLSQRDGRL
jgi:hypothetical protein